MLPTYKDQKKYFPQPITVIGHFYEARTTTTNGIRINILTKASPPIKRSISFELAIRFHPKELAKYYMANKGILKRAHTWAHTWKKTLASSKEASRIIKTLYMPTDLTDRQRKNRINKHGKNMLQCCAKLENKWIMKDDKSKFDKTMPLGDEVYEGKIESDENGTLYCKKNHILKSKDAVVCVSFKDVVG